MNARDDLTPRPGDALVVVDVQNDFVTGSLAVPRAAAVVAPLARTVEAFRARALPVVATRDWHPLRHCSFAAQGGPWPPHCVQDSHGAAFAAALRLPPEAVVVSKGTDPDAEAYSGFKGTSLAAELRARGVRRLFIGGLATDYCVLNTVQDAIAEGFDVVVLVDGIAAVDVHPGDGAKALDAMRRGGARFARTGDAVGTPAAPRS
jgi:nicotinamidase/pyrazinamidase